MRAFESVRSQRCERLCIAFLGDARRWLIFGMHNPMMWGAKRYFRFLERRSRAIDSQLLQKLNKCDETTI